MNKKLLAILVAALVLVGATACGTNNDPKETLPPVGGDTIVDSTGVVVPGTDANGSSTYETIPVEPETSKPIEVNPTFVDKSLTVVVIAGRGTVRNQPNMTEESKIAWPAEGTQLKVTGESADWYRLSYGESVGYITKAIVADAAALEGFTPVEETITVTGDVNVRSYPSADSDYSIRTSLKSGATVTRVGVGEKWSRIRITMTEKNEAGEDVEVVREYYINNNYIKAPETVAGTEATTNAATEASTETPAA